jgi:hypothetical protein
MRDPIDLIQPCLLIGNLIEGLLLIFTINCSVMFQLEEPNRGSWTFGDSVFDAFSLEIQGVIEGVYKEKWKYSDEWLVVLTEK